MPLTSAPGGVRRHLIRADQPSPKTKYAASLVGRATPSHTNATPAPKTADVSSSWLPELAYAKQPAMTTRTPPTRHRTNRPHFTAKSTGAKRVWNPLDGGVRRDVRSTISYAEWLGTRPLATSHCAARTSPCANSRTRRTPRTLFGFPAQPDSEAMQRFRANARRWQQPPT
jgi:hypothetical protein